MSVTGGGGGLREPAAREVDFALNDFKSIISLTESHSFPHASVGRAPGECFDCSWCLGSLRQNSSCYSYRLSQYQ